MQHCMYTNLRKFTQQLPPRFLPRILDNTLPQLQELKVALPSQPARKTNILVASNLHPARQMHRRVRIHRMVSLNVYRRVLALVHKRLIAMVGHAHVLFLEILGLVLEAAVAEAVQRQAVQVLQVDEHDDQHAPLRVRRAFDGEGDASVLRVVIWVRVGGVEWGGDYVA